MKYEILHASMKYIPAWKSLNFICFPRELFFPELLFSFTLYLSLLLFIFLFHSLSFSSTFSFTLYLLLFHSFCSCIYVSVIFFSFTFSAFALPTIVTRKNSIKQLQGSRCTTTRTTTNKN